MRTWATTSVPWPNPTTSRGPMTPCGSLASSTERLKTSTKSAATSRAGCGAPTGAGSSPSAARSTPATRAGAACCAAARWFSPRPCSSCTWAGTGSGRPSRGTRRTCGS
uniref:(northern house mosquito) hypothetical protein n=1 Tax=Culex pipiens TaxID=7175 RepID=A0A8D8MYL7_CULPI